jgi:signal transduction histidine kinase
MKHPSTQPILIIAGMLAGAILAWMVINVSVAIEVMHPEASLLVNLIDLLKSSSAARLETGAIFFSFVFLGGLATYASLVRRKIVVYEEEVRRTREADAAKNVFISMLLHFIRTPLAGIRWSLDSMRGKPNLGVAERHQVDMLYEETLRALDAVEHLLDVSRSSVGNIAYTFAPLSAESIIATINHAVEEIQPQADNKKIRVSIHSSPPSPRLLAVDRSKIQIAVGTLLENAISYTPEGGSIVVSVEEKKDGLYCTVTDNGIGIPTHDQEKIFMQFYRSENARRKRPDGFGVGLYMIKMFIEKHGGKIWFESKEGSGSSFTFRLPYAPEEREKAAA